MQRCLIRPSRYNGLESRPENHGPWAEGGSFYTDSPPVPQSRQQKKYNVTLKPKKQALHSVGCHKHLFHSRRREYRPAITFLLEPSLVPTAVNVSAWYSFTTWAFVENEYCGRRLMENSSQFHSSILSCMKLSQVK